ncbi:hypothetical protein Scep_014475 [Stephania cephalantha]|uniref:Uncharacterized protein n=1 Tax=Stephania cephalantha TaxID=152367 RepID=A0AAP0J1A9_9MAGN
MKRAGVQEADTWRQLAGREYSHMTCEKLGDRTDVCLEDNLMDAEMNRELLGRSVLIELTWQRLIGENLLVTCYERVGLCHVAAGIKRASVQEADTWRQLAGREYSHKTCEKLGDCNGASIEDNLMDTEMNRELLGRVVLVELTWQRLIGGNLLVICCGRVGLCHGGLVRENDGLEGRAGHAGKHVDKLVQ